MDTPTPGQVRDASELLSAKWPAHDPENARLVEAVAEAIAYVQSVTGRVLGPPGTEAASAYVLPAEMEQVPAGLEPVARRAVRLAAEQIAVNDEMKTARQRAARLRLRGFTAGPYSEQYWDPGMVRKAAGVTGRPLVADDPDLDDALWAIMTEAAADAWRALVQGIMPPAGMATVFDYRKLAGRRGRRHGYGRGPDGF